MKKENIYIVFEDIYPIGVFRDINNAKKFFRDKVDEALRTNRYRISFRDLVDEYEDITYSQYLEQVADELHFEDVLYVREMEIND